MSQPPPPPRPPPHPPPLPPPPPPPRPPSSPDAVYQLDARGIAKRFRQPAIVGALDSLLPGETMRFINDQDPLPLLEQLKLRYGERVSATYRHRETGAIVIDFAVH